MKLLIFIGAWAILVAIGLSFLADYLAAPKIPPVAPAVVSSPPPFLSQISHGSRSLPQIALTFDADMTPSMLRELQTGTVSSWYNREIIDILKRGNLPATLFITGLWAETYPEITKELSQNPLFDIASHSYSHPRFTSKCNALPPIPAWGKDQEFQKSIAILKKITGRSPSLFRFPGGCRNSNDIAMANNYGLTVVDWDVASGDSFNTNLSAMVNTIKTRTQNGSIILFHLNGNRNAPRTVEVLSSVIPFLRQKGFDFVKISDLIKNL